MKILIDQSEDGRQVEIAGDPIHIADQAMTHVRSAIYNGETIFVMPMEGPFDWCAKCESFTANHEPRLDQETRYERGYYTCPVCGYVKEGVVPDVDVT